MATSGANSRSLLLLLLTSGFFITGILFDYMPIIVDSQIKRTVELATNEEVQTIWSRPPVDLHTYYWLYNITNPEEFMKGEKVRVKKVGPYHFTSRVEKKIIELSANKYRIIYNMSRNMHFNELEHELAYEQWKKSLATNGNSIMTKMDDNLLLLNPVYATVVEATREMAHKMDPEMKPMVIGSANRLTEKFNETLIVNITARQSLMGRKLVFINKARKMIETFGLSDNLPDVLKGDVFGFVAVVNGTWFGPYEIYTGYQASMSSLGDLISYQGKRRLKEYRGKCNRLQASVGELRPMPISEGQSLEMFVPSFCRILKLQATGVRKLREGLAVSYIHHTHDFKNATFNHDNECYCVNGTIDNYCSLNGAIELAPCSYYLPLVLTTNIIEPDPRMTGSIEDYDPELLSSDVDSIPKADNLAQLLILKRIGIPVRADITYTLFIRVVRDTKFRQTELIPEVSYVPVATVRELASLPTDLGQIVVNLENFIILTQHMKVIMYLSSIVLLCWLTGHYYNRSARERVVPAGAGSWAQSAGGALGAVPDSSAASDRANSADSSRSQPPSRIISRAGSIDVRSTSAASGEQKQVNEPVLNKTFSNNTANPSTVARSEFVDGKTNNATTTTTASSKQQQLGADRDATRARRAIRAARVFSKVDEERDNNLKTIAWRNSKQQQEPPLGSSKVSSVQVAQSEAINYNQSNELATTVNSNSNNNSISISGPEKGMLVKVNGENGDTEAANSFRKNWFMKVCSNFVRMLSGIRGTISEAGQLDISDNDYRDKQLELLAGKIDNWYNSNESRAIKEENNNSEESGCGVELEAAQQLAATNERGLKSSSNNTEQSNLRLADKSEKTQVDTEQRKVEGSKPELGEQEEEVAVEKRNFRRGTARRSGGEASEQFDALAQLRDTEKSLAINNNSNNAQNAASSEVQKRVSSEKAIESKGTTMKVAESSEGQSKVTSLAASKKEFAGDSSTSELEAEKQAESAKESGPTSREQPEAQQVQPGKAAKEEELDGDGDGDAEEEEEELEVDSKAASRDSNEPTNAQTNHISRRDSVQSNQTIINKSDTSGDESVEASSLVSLKQNKEDKAAAFEQMEMAMAQ